jgi:hypothetical protein
MGAMRLLGYWLRFILPPADRQLLIRFVADVRPELSKRSQEQIDALLEIMRATLPKPDPYVLTLLALARVEVTHAEETRKSEN